MIPRKAELIIHPVRLRVLRLLGDREMTVEEMHRHLGDVPIATLYRHVNTLTENHMLQVAGQQRKRGTIEKRYALAPGGGTLQSEDVKYFTHDEHRQYFTAFAAHLLQDFNHYLDHCNLDETPNDIGYHQNSLFLSPGEQKEFVQEVQALVKRYAALPAGNDRRQMLLSTIFMPGECHDDET